MREHDAAGHRLAVQERAVVACLRFQRVGEGVAEIEQGAVAALALVAGDDARLRPAGMGHRGPQQVLVAVDQRLTVLFEPVEEGGVVDEAVLHDLGIAGPPFAQRQRGERRHVGEHQPRLVEAADQVLAVAAVDAGLAADAAVRLGEKRRRDLDEGDAAQQDARGEAGEVADHPAAECDQHGRSLDSPAEDALQHACQRFEVLAALAGPDHQVGTGEARLPQRLQGGVEIAPGDAAVGDHDRRAAGETRCQEAPRLGQQPGADQHVVAARAERDVHRLPVLDGSCAGSRAGAGAVHCIRPRRLLPAGAHPARCAATRHGRRARRAPSAPSARAARPCFRR